MPLAVVIPLLEEPLRPVPVTLAIIVGVGSQDIHPLPFPPLLSDSGRHQVPPGVGFGPSGVSFGPLLSFVLAATHFEARIGLFPADFNFIF